jgi:hypothetical protein
LFTLAKSYAINHGRGGALNLGAVGIIGNSLNCPSPVLSSASAGYDHDPWPLHSPAPSRSPASQGSRDGDFSPPPLAHEHNVDMNARHGYNKEGGQVDVQGGVQLGSNRDDGSQALASDLGGGSMDMDLEAAAPAFKAPRAP